MVTRFVVGFAFSHNLRWVCLIRKERPAWQRGLLNGPGGHIEEGEEPIEAMVREFREETGLESNPGDWRKYAVLTDNKFYEVHFFYSRNVDTMKVQSTTDEPISMVRVEELENAGTVPNLPWLITMAISFEMGEKCQEFQITEIAEESPTA